MEAKRWRCIRCAKQILSTEKPQLREYGVGHIHYYVENIWPLKNNTHTPFKGRRGYQVGDEFTFGCYCLPRKHNIVGEKGKIIERYFTLNRFNGYKNYGARVVVISGPKKGFKFCLNNHQWKE